MLLLTLIETIQNYQFSHGIGVKLVKETPEFSNSYNVNLTLIFLQLDETNFE
jgi:hypothetical protein